MSSASIADAVGTTKIKAAQAGWRALLVGSILLPFSYGADTVALTAWLAPVFLLRFTRELPLRLSLPVLGFVLLLASAFQLRGMFDFADDGTYWFSMAAGVVPALIPYAADRLIARSLGGALGSLVFPCASTVIDYVNSFGPFGSWGAAGYSQYGELPLLQLLSVTGLWGLTFLMGWFAATCNTLWQEGWASRRVRGGVYACFGAIAVVILGGGLRLALQPPAGKTVRVASFSVNQESPPALRAAVERLAENRATQEDLAAIGERNTEIGDELLARADRAAGQGARIAFWAEGNAMLLKPDEPAFIARGAELARRDGIYLGMALASWTQGAPKPLENKLVMVGPDGQVAWQYEKSLPVPGDEQAVSVPGDGRLRSLDTPYGRLGAIICFDGDFPQLVAQAGEDKVDILLDPSNDWQAIDPWHTEMASFRAIEQGVNLVRQTSHGLSAVFDDRGAPLAAMDHFRTADHTMIADVPIAGTRTVYAWLGDWFAWLSVLGFLVLAGWALRLRIFGRRQRQ